jgi:uncharacterized protein (TIGR03118 family)
MLKRLKILAAAAALVALALVAGAPAAAPTAYAVHNLTSDQAGVADHQDPNLVNAWGLAARGGSPWWIADNGMDVSTLYLADGTPFPPATPLVFPVPHKPTGLVANSGAGFVVSGGASFFIFSTEEGGILGWHPGLPAAVPAPIQASPGAIYKGLAIAGDRLYATDFHNGKVDVWDGSWTPVNLAGAFTDPNLPHGFAPFGIQNVGGTIVVTYAKQDDDAEDDVAGVSLGIVDAYDQSGTLLARVATRGLLNSPWGVALAPSTFGGFAGDLLVGNFGDGAINAFKQLPAGNWEPDGQLRGTDGKKIAIDGLWALQFGIGGNNGSPDTLFFTAGPDDESHGLFGTITPS